MARYLRPRHMDRGRTRAVGDDAADDPVPVPFVKQAGRVVIGEAAGLRRCRGRLAAIELNRRRPEAPDGVERRAVGVEEDRNSPRAGQRDQVAVEPVGRRGRTRAGERQRRDVAARAPPRRAGASASASSGVMAGSGSKNAVCSALDSVRTVKITRVGASVGTTSGSRPSSDRSSDSHWRRRSAQERDRPRLSAQPSSAGRRCFPCRPPPRGRPSRAPGRPAARAGPSASCPDRGSSVTHRIMARDTSEVRPMARARRRSGRRPANTYSARIRRQGNGPVRKNRRDRAETAPLSGAGSRRIWCTRFSLGRFATKGFGRGSRPGPPNGECPRSCQFLPDCYRMLWRSPAACAS